MLFRSPPRAPAASTWMSQPHTQRLEAKQPESRPGLGTLRAGCVHVSTREECEGTAHHWDCAVTAHPLLPRADTLPWLLLPGGQASKRGAQQLLLEAHGAGSSGGTGRPPGPHASPRWAAQCPVRPHAQGPQEAFHPDSPACAHQPPAGPADQLLGAWCGSHPSRKIGRAHV